MSKSKTPETPLDVSLKLSKLDSPETGSNEHREMQSCDYRAIVACLNCFALTSRPGIANAANLLSSFVSVISWASKLQTCVSTSTAEAELNAVVEASKGAVHLVNLLRELDLEIQQPFNVFVDNQACIALCKNSMNHGKTKHFALKVLFVRKLFKSWLFELNRQKHLQKHWDRPKYNFFVMSFSEQTLNMTGGVLKV